MGKLFGLDKIGDKSQLCIDYFKLKKVVLFVFSILSISFSKLQFGRI